MRLFSSTDALVAFAVEIRVSLERGTDKDGAECYGEREAGSHGAARSLGGFHGRKRQRARNVPFPPDAGVNISLEDARAAVSPLQNTAARRLSAEGYVSGS